MTVMTRKEVRDLLIRKGFNLREVMSQEYTVVEHKGEVVGFIYDYSVYVAKNYPSLNIGEKSYPNTERTVVSFTSPIKMLEEAIDFLFDSPRRLDREMRDKRIENVRKYFKDRNDRKYADKVLSQPIYDYEKLIKQLSKHSTEENLQ